MGIEYRVGDVLESATDVIVHGCNCFNSFGAGIARQIKYQYPEAYHEDTKTVYGDKSKLGTFTYSVVFGGIIVCNAYTQFDCKPYEINVDYEAIEKSMVAIKKNLTQHLLFQCHELDVD